MVKTIYKQYDSRWGSLPYPGSGSNLSNSGCGCLAVLHCAIETEKYRKLTPQDCRKYMVQYATVDNGTLWNGITKGLEHYGYKVHWREADTMADIWKQLQGSCKRGVILFAKKDAAAIGPDGTCWTTIGHYCAYTDFKVEGGKHWFYIKDSGARNHDGWYSYEKSMKGCIRNLWVCKSVTDEKAKQKTPSTAKSKYKVIDISYWQSHNKPKIDFNKVKADGVVGVIVRYADGEDNDGYFDAHMKGAKAAGLHIGAYIYSRAKTKAQAEKEAKRLFDACKKYKPDMPLYIDLEAKGLEKYADTVAQAFLNKIKTLGGYGGVYANLNWWRNYLTKTAKGSFAMWLAQHNDSMDYKPASDVGMWQYSSSGSVKGISGRVDMDWCYVAYWDKINPKKKGYDGKFPTYRLTKSNAKVKADACRWAKIIASDNDFHYGSNEHAYHNGCYYCGTQHMKMGHGIKMPEYTYCCNPFVGAAWAHGGGDAEAYRLCHNCKSWGFAKNEGYEKSSLFDKLGHPAKSKLKAGDVLCADSHVVLYIGDGKIAEAATRDDNVIGSDKWNDSIRVTTLTDARYKGLPRAYRYNGKVDCDRVISEGEYSDRVKDLQAFLKWYFGNNMKSTGFFGPKTLKYVIKFQEKELGKGQGDGLVGPKTIEAMKKVKK